MIQLVLTTQLEKMCALGKQALEWNEPEGVHDMRVVSRRLRSAISDFKPYLRKPGLPLSPLRAIARSLGAVRDEDVALAALEELKAKATGLAAEGIEMLAEERRRRRVEACAALEKSISRSAIAEFRAESTTKVRAIELLRSRKSTKTEAGDSILTFGQVGAEVITERLKEVRKASTFIYLPFEIKDLHELRILAKRLRYAIELFGLCWGKELKEIAKEIALWQTSLGEMHDCDVWIADLGLRLKPTARTVKSDPENIRAKEAATWLLKHFARERMDHYRDALTRWNEWESEGLLDRLGEILSVKVSAVAV